MAGNEGLSQTGLVDRTGIDRSTLADIVRRMQRKGLLQRRRTREDARAYAVKLTDEGRRLLRVAEPLGKRVDERILDALPTKQRMTLELRIYEDLPFKEIGQALEISEGAAKVNFHYAVRKLRGLLAPQGEGVKPPGGPSKATRPNVRR